MLFREARGRLSQWVPGTEPTVSSQKNKIKLDFWICCLCTLAATGSTGRQSCWDSYTSVLTQIPTEQTIIPFGINSDTEADEDNSNQEACYEYEPDEMDILKDLLPKNLSIQVFRALLENFASEQGARMSAMDNATRNASEMIDKLKITYNRSRQATITSELIEIISGAEAL